MNMKTYADENEDILRYIEDRHHDTNLHTSMDIYGGYRTCQPVGMDVDLEIS